MDGGALLLGEERGRGFFDQLLEAALQGAIARADDDYVAVLIRQHLGLDVAGSVQVTLYEALAATEGGGCLTGSGFKKFGDLLCGVGHLHAAAAAAKGSLDGYGQAVFHGEGLHLIGAGYRILGAWGHGGFGTLGDVPRGNLISQVTDGLGGGANPSQAGVDDGLGKVGVFRQEAIAGVDGIGAGFFCGVQNLVKDEVGLGRSGAAEGKGFVGKRGKRCLGVWLGVDGDGGNASVAGRADHANGDLTAVRHENLRDLFGFYCHGSNLLNTLG